MAASCVTKLTTFCVKSSSKRLYQTTSQPVLYNHCFFGAHRPSQVANLRKRLHQTCILDRSCGYHSLCKNSVSKLTEVTSRSPALTFVPLRRASSDDKQDEEPRLSTITPIRNPLNMFRDWMYSFLIQVFFDPDFTLREFTVGAKEAVLVVSEQISQGAFEKVEELLSSSVLTEFKTIYNKLTEQERKFLAVGKDGVSYPHGIAVHYDSDGSTKVIKVKITLRYIWGYKDFIESKERDIAQIRHCDYEFHRDFSPGIAPEWTITGIQYSSFANKNIKEHDKSDEQQKQ